MLAARAPPATTAGPSRPGFCFQPLDWRLQKHIFVRRLPDVKRERFLSAIRRWCRDHDRSFHLDRVAGKGSHIKVYVDGRGTIVKDGELSPVYVGLVLKQLGLPRDLL